ncbi:hypothetical protein RQP46_011121 [Phenoliferia psychrophenolica]
MDEEQAQRLRLRTIHDLQRFTRYFKFPNWAISNAALGSGATASVYQCVFRPNTPQAKVCAVKIFQAEAAQSYEASVYRQFRLYLHMRRNMQSTGAEFIVHMIKSAPDLLVFEFMQTDLERFGPKLTTEAQYMHVMNGIINGIGFIHGLGIIHADLKPANILIQSVVNPSGTRTWVPKLADFGAARFEGPVEIAPTFVMAGTRGYMPPEVKLQLYRPDGHRRRDVAAPLVVTKPGDIWAFACIVFM